MMTAYRQHSAILAANPGAHIFCPLHAAWAAGECAKAVAPACLCPNPGLMACSYTGTIDLDQSLGHNYTLAVTVTVDFCNAVQKTVQGVCQSAGSVGNFISVLDQKCQIFLDPSALPGQNVPVQVSLYSMSRSSAWCGQPQGLAVHRNRLALRA